MTLTQEQILTLLIWPLLWMKVMDSFLPESGEEAV